MIYKGQIAEDLNINQKLKQNHKPENFISLTNMIAKQELCLNSIKIDISQKQTFNRRNTERKHHLQEKEDPYKNFMQHGRLTSNPILKGCGSHPPNVFLRSAMSQMSDYKQSTFHDRKNTGLPNIPINKMTPNPLVNKLSEASTFTRLSTRVSTRQDTLSANDKTIYSNTDSPFKAVAEFSVTEGNDANDASSGKTCDNGGATTKRANLTMIQLPQIPSAHSF